MPLLRPRDRLERERPFWARFFPSPPPAALFQSSRRYPWGGDGFFLLPPHYPPHHRYFARIGGPRWLCPAADSSPPPRHLSAVWGGGTPAPRPQTSPIIDTSRGLLALCFSSLCPLPPLFLLTAYYLCFLYRLGINFPTPALSFHSLSLLELCDLWSFLFFSPSPMKVLEWLSAKSIYAFIYFILYFPLAHLHNSGNFEQNFSDIALACVID